MTNAPLNLQPLTQSQYAALLDAAKRRAHELRRQESGLLVRGLSGAAGRLWRAVRPPVRGAA